MEPKKILITGGLGYIGSHTVVLFANAGYELVLLDNLSNTHKESVLAGLKELTGKDLPFYEGDVRDFDFLDQLFEKEQFDGVIHFAAKKAVGESCHDPFLYYDNNITGTTTLLQVMDKYQVKKLIFSSSATVYDAEKNLAPFTETDRLNTTNPYGTTKLTMEFLLKDMAQHKGFSVVCLRYFNPVGAHHSGLLGENPKWIPTNLVPFLLRVAKKEIESITVFGDNYPTPDGTCIRDYIHIEDLAQAHLQSYDYLLQQEVELQTKENWSPSKFEVFNIGTWTGKSVKEILIITESIVWESISHTVWERRDGDVAVSVANPTKARQVLHWEPQKTIVDAVQDAWNFYSRA